LRFSGLAIEGPTPGKYTGRAQFDASIPRLEAYFEFSGPPISSAGESVCQGILVVSGGVRWHHLFLASTAKRPDHPSLLYRFNEPKLLPSTHAIIPRKPNALTQPPVDSPSPFSNPRADPAPRQGLHYPHFQSSPNLGISFLGSHPLLSYSAPTRYIGRPIARPFHFPVPIHSHDRHNHAGVSR